MVIVDVVPVELLNAAFGDAVCVAGVLKELDEPEEDNETDCPRQIEALAGVMTGADGIGVIVTVALP